MAKLISFSDALGLAKGKKMVLLGNGFSQACRANIFSYGSLFEKADFKRFAPNAGKAFSALDTTNFEFVIKALRDAAVLVPIYEDKKSDLAGKMQKDSSALKNLLVNTIATHHPGAPSEITDEEFAACRKFLKNFSKIYTLNYDLLLYWTCMHSQDTGDKIRCDDGFRHPDGADEAEYVSWEIENSNEQNIYYLHGALHLFESETELMKYTWSRTGVKLMTQINSALAQDIYPMIVAEGTSDQKMARIMRSAYLQRGLKSLASSPGALFIFGMGLHDNDEHILKRIRKGKFTQLWVGIYGNPDSPDNKQLMSRAKLVADESTSRKKIEVYFFDTSTAKVWG